MDSGTHHDAVIGSHPGSKAPLFKSTERGLITLATCHSCEDLMLRNRELEGGREGREGREVGVHEGQAEHETLLANIVPILCFHFCGWNVRFAWVKEKNGRTPRPGFAEATKATSRSLIQSNKAWQHRLYSETGLPKMERWRAAGSESCAGSICLRSVGTWISCLVKGRGAFVGGCQPLFIIRPSAREYMLMEVRACRKCSISAFKAPVEEHSARRVEISLV